MVFTAPPRGPNPFRKGVSKSATAEALARSTPWANDPVLTSRLTIVMAEQSAMHTCRGGMVGVD